MRNVARRLDATERSQSENNRAMTKAATEINVATREQAQAFEQLGTHVVKLTDRSRAWNTRATTDPIRDAVKGLHQGLSRLADQISETARQSATQIKTLAHNVESVAAKLAEAEQSVRALEEKLQTSIGALEEKLQSRAAELDERGETALEKSRRKRSTGWRHGSPPPKRKPPAPWRGWKKPSTSCMQDSGATGAMDKRLSGHRTRAGRYRGPARRRPSATPLPSRQDRESLHNLGQQIEAAEKRQRESVAELRNALKDTTARVDAIDGWPPHAIPPAPARHGHGRRWRGPHGADAAGLRPAALPAESAAASAALRRSAPRPGGSFDLPPPPYDLAPAPGAENMYSAAVPISRAATSLPAANSQSRFGRTPISPPHGATRARPPQPPNAAPAVPTAALPGAPAATGRGAAQAGQGRAAAASC